MVQKELKLFEKYIDLINFTYNNIKSNLRSFVEIKNRIENELMGKDFKDKLLNHINICKYYIEKDLENFIEEFDKK